MNGNGLYKRNRPAAITFIVVTAFLHGFLAPPLNSEFTPLYFFLPFVSALMIPAFLFVAVTISRFRDVLRAWLWGCISVGAGSYWILEVDVIEIPWIMVPALLLLSLFFGGWYLLLGGVLRLVYRYMPAYFWVATPALWVIFDRLKCVGQLSFPWHYEAYTFSHFLPFARISAVTGVWGLTFIIVLLGTTFFQFLMQKRRYLLVLLFLESLLTAGLIAGTAFATEDVNRGEPLRAALIQSNIDQVNWEGWTSLERALHISDSMIARAADSGADLVVLPESGVLTYLSRNPNARSRIESWRRNYNVHIITGALDKEEPPRDSMYYNGAFYYPAGDNRSFAYYKHKLVPYGESMPLKGVLPMINPRDLGGADFSPGRKRSLWSVQGFAALPLICYEAIYPSFVRQGAEGADLLVNITNDRWFGLGVGPYQHRTIARLRAVENGLPLLRCANSGISYAADGSGTILASGNLGTREIVMAEVYPGEPSFYNRHGDWFIWFCGGLTVVLALTALIQNRRSCRKGEKT
ncbi:MAG: apolipoprotein N-acyltransferase [Fibrobacterota bacterium]